MRRESYRTDRHEKSMHQYQWHARSDAIAIAALIREMVDLKKAKAIFEESNYDIAKIERWNASLISNFI
jgi:hypothetical protein